LEEFTAVIGATVPESAPLTHFWSLGIEEQFYLIFPVTLLLLTKFKSSVIRLWACHLLSHLSVSELASTGTYAHPTATFYLLPTRVWELLFGAGFAAHIVRMFSIIS
jgi:peptidoglycan/LPS O-acetylase OafA/YrhL